MLATPKGNTMWNRRLIAMALVCALAACSGDPAPADDAVGTAPGEPAAAVSQDAPASDAVATLSVDELRAAASRAYQESRLYAPAGDNAIEYYLALREREPGDAGASSALIDLLPMAVIATEQARDREDFEEARRLQALIQRTDGSHPAVGRLGTSIDNAQAASEQRIAQQALSSEREAERRKQLEAERAKQQQEQQAQAARELAAQQEASREAEQQAERDAAAREAVSYTRQLVEFTVAADGSVSNARVVRADPPRVFDREALTAVRRWRFEPMDAPITTRRTIGFTPGGG